MSDTTDPQLLSAHDVIGSITFDADHRELLDQVLDKWSMQVVALLCEGPQRFSELRRGMVAITAKSLTATLRRLERNGMVARDVAGTGPLSVTYRVTELGKSFDAPLEAIGRWTTGCLAEVSEARARFDRQHGSPA